MRCSIKRSAVGRPATPPNCTTSPAGARATSPSTKTGTSASIRPRIPTASIDLKQLVDRLQLRGIDLPILIRFADILKHRLGEIHDAFQPAITEHKYKGNYFCVYPIKVNQQRQVVEEVLRLRPAVSISASRPAASRSCWPSWRMAVERHADHLQRLQGRRVHRDGDAGAEDRPAASFRSSRNTPSWSLILEYAEKVGVRPTIGMRVKLAARGGGRWQSSGGYRSKFGLTVSEILRGLEELKARGMAGLLQAAALSPRQPDPQHPPHQGRAERSRARLRRAGQAAARAWSTSTSAAAWASTTTARRPTSNRASTTRCRNTPTTSSITCRASATKPACRIRRSSPKAAGRSWPITARWCSTCWACRAWARATCRRKLPDDVEQPLHRPARHLSTTSPCATCWKAITTRSRRSTWR